MVLLFDPHPGRYQQCVLAGAHLVHLEEVHMPIVVLVELVKIVQVLAGPEIAFEDFVLRSHLAQAKELAEDHRPARQRGDQQARHHQLHHQARLQYEAENREVLVHGIGLIISAEVRW